MQRINVLSKGSNISFLCQCVLNRKFSADRHCKLLIIGGGAGGCSIAAKFTASSTPGAVIVIEPADVHYYQPMFTLVGGGMKSLKESSRRMKDVLPKKADWIKDPARKIEASKNYVVTQSGLKVFYEYLVVAAGLCLDYDKIPGLVEGLNSADSGVCSNYSPLYVQKTYDSLKRFQKGNLVFTFPNTPVKCPGAPQKICYIAEDYLRQNGKRDSAKVIYNTSLGVLFGVKKYADQLWKICQQRGIQVNLRTNLVEVKPDSNTAVFQNLDNLDDKKEIQYSVLHVTPPMSPAPVVRSCPQLADSVGFLDINKSTLQHKTFPNVFGIGDCTNAPTAKTAAAVAAQCGILEKNLSAVMAGKEPKMEYNGYTSCPLVTGYSSCILAEFDYNLQPLETFPFDQGLERRSMFYMKKSLMPALYWNGMLRGYWNGPRGLRDIMRFNFTS